MYTFQGVKVSKKRFWQLSEIAKDLLLLEKELDKEEGKEIDNKLVQELINEHIKEEVKLGCPSCGSKLILNQSKFGSIFTCSNICKCTMLVV